MIKELYHGSLYEQSELMPGFKHTGKVVYWDGGIESNKWLYATSVKDEAIRLGLGSALEKTFETDRFSYVDDLFFIWNDKPFNKQQIYNLKIYLYTIPFNPEVWVKNDNPYNQIDTEWVTQQTVVPSARQQIALEQYLRGKTFIITNHHDLDVSPMELVNDERVTKLRF